MIKRNRIFLLLLCCLTLCFLFASCGKEKSAEKLENAVFAETEVAFPDGWTLKTEIPPVWNGTEYLVTAYRRSEDGTSAESVFALSPDGSVRETDNAADSPDAMGMIPLSDGGSVLTWLDYRGNDRCDVTAEVRDAKGKTQFTVSLCGLFDWTLTETDVSAGVFFPCLGALKTGGRVLLLTEKGLCALDEKGALLWKAADRNRFSAVFSVKSGSEETVFCLYSPNGTPSLAILDPASGEITETVALPPEMENGGALSTATTIPGSGYDFLYRRTDGLTGVKLEKADGSWTLRTESAADWVASGIDPEEVGALAFQDAEHLLLYRQDPHDFRNVAASLLTRIPPEEVPDKEILNVALLTSGTSIAKAAAQFNRESKTHRVVFTDYAAMEVEYEQRYQFFEADLAAGKIPDAVILASTSNMDYKVETYISRELFCDLTPLMEADETFDDEGLLGVVTKPYQYKGKQPIFPVEMSVSSLIASDRYLTPDENGNAILTPGEAISLLEDLPSGTELGGVYASAFLGQTIVDDYTDRENGTCSYDDGRFAARLAAIDALPKEEQKERTTTAEERQKVADGSWLLYQENNLFYLGAYAEVEAGLGGVPVFVSWPNENGSMYAGSDFGLRSIFAVPEAAEQKEAAIDFLEVCLSCTGCVHFVSDVERQFEELSEMTLVMRDGFGWWCTEEELQYQTEGVRFKITPEQKERYLRFLNSADSIVHICTPLKEIYDEEKSRPNTAEQFIDAVTARTKLYMAEVYG